MCFKNLPIEFDAAGRAHLKEGVANPYAYVANGHPLEREERIKELLSRNGHIKEISIDPVTRVAGALAFHSVVDLENRTVHDAHSMATLFSRLRNYSQRSRSARRDFHFESRLWRVRRRARECRGGSHRDGVRDRPATDGHDCPQSGPGSRFLYDHPLHLFLLAVRTTPKRSSRRPIRTCGPSRSKLRRATPRSTASPECRT